MIMHNIVQTFTHLLALCVLCWVTVCAYADPDYTSNPSLPDTDPALTFPNINNLDDTRINESMYFYGNYSSWPEEKMPPGIIFDTTDQVGCTLGKEDGDIFCDSYNPIYVRSERHPIRDGKCMDYAIFVGHLYDNYYPATRITWYGYDSDCTIPTPPAKRTLYEGHKIHYGPNTCGKLPGHVLACTNGKHELIMKPGQIWGT